MFSYFLWIVNRPFWRSYEFLDVTVKFYAKNHPKGPDFQPSTTLGGGVNKMVYFFAMILGQKWLSRKRCFTKNYENRKQSFFEELWIFGRHSRILREKSPQRPRFSTLYDPWRRGKRDGLEFLPWLWAKNDFHEKDVFRKWSIMMPRNPIVPRSSFPFRLKMLTISISPCYGWEKSARRSNVGLL